MRRTILSMLLAGGFAWFPARGDESKAEAERRDPRRQAAGRGDRPAGRRIHGEVGASRTARRPPTGTVADGILTVAAATS